MQQMIADPVRRARLFKKARPDARTVGPVQRLS
jgi:hypothetical protein